jgi:glycerophosphoryl diester phosphodiesterase
MKRLLAVLALALVLPVAAQPARPLVAAHRGGALLWPENSLLAFTGALALGVDFLETDVHLTADGEVVVLHDPTLERTTTGTGAVRDARLADLAALRLRARDGSVTDERLPTLARLLDVLRPSGAGLLLEIKVGADRQPYPSIEDRALALVRAGGLLDRVVFMAFEAETIARVHAREPAARTLLLVSARRAGAGGGADAVRWTVEAGASSLGLDYRAVDAATVQAARGAGVRLAAWTVNEEADITRMFGLGVDLVISDRPDLAQRLRQP